MSTAVRHIFCFRTFPHLSEGFRTMRNSAESFRSARFRNIRKASWVGLSRRVRTNVRTVVREWFGIDPLHYGVLPWSAGYPQVAQWPNTTMNGTI